MSGNRRADKYVSNRRLQEDRTNFLNTKLKEEFQMKELARFENKGKDVTQANYVKKRLSELRDQHTRNIESKRLQLRALLEQENEQYKAEIRNLQDTPEQVREKMINRVQELRTTKEAQRRQEVAEKLERRFREGADELRKVGADFNELKNMHLRNLQMMEKQKLMEQQYEEGMIYAELSKRDMYRKEQREKHEVEDRILKNDERNQVLNWQKEEALRARQAELDRIEAEKRMLKETWKSEEARQKEQELKNLELNKELNRELYDHNVAQRAIKDYNSRVEKETDKMMVTNIVERERMLDSLEKEFRERQKKETREFLLNFKNRASELNMQEAELEKLIKEEMEKQHARQDAEWKKEEDARIKLMYQVYDSRAGDIDRKKQIGHEEKVEKVVEKEIVTKDILDYEDEIRRKKEEEWRRNKNQQSHVLNQIDDKREIERRKLQEKMEQERAEVLAREEYMRKVQEEKEKGRKLLDELRKQRPF